MEGEDYAPECETCAYFSTDLTTGENYCGACLDEDDIAEMIYKHHKICPFYKGGDEYTIVRKQI